MSEDMKIVLSFPKSIRALGKFFLVIIFLLEVIVLLQENFYDKLLYTAIFTIFTLIIIWSLLFKITVKSTEISVKNGLVKTYFFDVSEITEISWEIVVVPMAKRPSETIKIYAKNHRFFVITAMEGFELFSEFLRENVESDKINFIATV